MEGRPESRRPPRPGSHPLRSEVVLHHKRRRIMAAAKELFVEHGYRGVSVADIVRASRIARGRFYEHFSSKQDCFFAAYDEAMEATLESVSVACAAEGDLAERVAAGVDALLAAIEADPVGARLCVLEGPAVGEALTPRSERAMRRFAAMLRSAQEGAPEPSQLPTTLEESVVGGLYWLLYYALLDGRPRNLSRLRPQMVEFSLLPFLGAEAAAAAAAA